MNDIVAAFLLGFLGSLHCVGMCGGLISILTMSRPRPWFSGLIVYQSGRIVTYMLLGLASGLIGAALVMLGVFTSLQTVLALVAGIIMLFFGLHLAGVMPDPLARWSARSIGGAGLAGRLRQAAENSLLIYWFLAGMANGLLPCGLVYAALALSIAAGNLIDAAAIMVAFGFGTVPAMMAAPAVLAKMAADRRMRLMKLLGWLVVLMAIVTMLRPFGLMHAGHGGHAMPVPAMADQHQ